MNPMSTPMNTIVELETEHGTTLYINPDHVASVLGVEGEGEPITIITVGVNNWRVKGVGVAIAAHIFSVATKYGPRAVAFARPGHAVRVERVPLGESVDLDTLLG